MQSSRLKPEARAAKARTAALLTKVVVVLSVKQAKMGQGLVQKGLALSFVEESQVGLTSKTSLFDNR